MKLTIPSQLQGIMLWPLNSDGVRPVIRIGPQPDELLVLSNGAVDLPFFPARGQRVLAHQSNYAIGATDTGANPIFPIFVVGFLNRHVNEFKWTFFK
jgi:hypothetical protein